MESGSLHPLQDLQQRLQDPNNKTITINYLTDFGHAISFFLVEYESKTYYRARTNQSNLSHMSSFSMCVVPRRAGHKTTVASDFLTSYRLKSCLPNPHKPCSIMTLKKCSTMHQSHVQNHPGMAVKAIFPLCFLPHCQRSLFCYSATQDNFTVIAISDKHTQDAKFAIKQ